MSIEEIMRRPTGDLDLKFLWDELFKIPPSAIVEAVRRLHYQAFLETGYWMAVANAVKERDGRRCKVCNSTKQIAAHHRRYMTRGTEHLCMEDLTTLCTPCHSLFHIGDAPKKKGLRVRIPSEKTNSKNRKAKSKRAKA